MSCFLYHYLIGRRCGKMEGAKRKPLILAYLVAITFSSGRFECVDKDISCPGWANSGECEINPSVMSCKCGLSCNTPMLCRENNTDTSCSCAFKVTKGKCETGNKKCPYSCAIRKNVTCGPPAQFPNALALGGRTYLHRATHVCRQGYRNQGGKGLQVCRESGQWTHPRNPPVCVTDTVAPCTNNTVAFIHVARSTTWGSTLLTTSSGGNVLECADSCLRRHGCTFFTFGNETCRTYYESGFPSQVLDSYPAWEKITSTP